ncbi:nitrogen regulation protein NR(II) [Inhella gelatinilytica]|uniref:histidine kinase n=1 Tax=Inhella gelatinilytica TaxID=2795030 RepID=A0A931IWW7_9BURK|nr:nitrogen regulation protein NR(II) [Inhella gelatinilytica]MBH9552510.1 PAS domain-containing protein [Inhella gelatinilytica]
MTPDFSAFDSLATLVLVVDPPGRVLFANTAFEDQVRLSRRTTQGRLAEDWFARPEAVREALGAVRARRFDTMRFEAQLLRPIPEDPLEVWVLVSAAAGGSALVLELVESTQQARHEREAWREDQQRSSKELIRNLAHEIKNPLGGLRGAAQLLALELGGASPLLEYTQVIVHEADRLQQLVDRLLEPHRPVRGFEPVNIHEVCERVRALVQAEFPQGLALLRDYDSSLPEFSGDREQLIQALLNVVRNAAQALGPQIQEGRPAHIRLRTRVARQVTLGKRLCKLALELLVEDNGPGVPPDLRDRLFLPLVTGRADGTGLGLHLAQTIVQAHQGALVCDSEPGRTVFRFLLPLT